MVDDLCYNINSDGTTVTVTYLKSYPNYPNLSGDLTIPASVTYGKTAFTGCGNLTSVAIPNSVTSIGEGVFYSCRGLTSVSIPNSITTLSKWAFGYCSGLTSVTIPNSFTTIDGFAFYWCDGMTSVTIPNSVTSIGDQVFSHCSSMTDFYTYIENPSTVSLGSDVFSPYVPTSTCVLHVPAGTTELYRTADQWNAFTNIVEMMTSIDIIATDHNSDGIYYNLLGQPVKNPTSGIYIHNGKKVIVR